MKLYAAPATLVGSPPKTNEARPTSAPKEVSHYEPIEFYGMQKSERDHKEDHHGDWVMLPEMSTSDTANTNE